MHRFKGKRQIEFQDLSDAIFTRLQYLSLHPLAFQQKPPKKTAANVSHPEGSLLPGRFSFSFPGLGLVGFRGKAAFWRTEIVYKLVLQWYHIPGEPEGRNPRRALLEEREPQQKSQINLYPALLFSSVETKSVTANKTLNHTHNI